MPLDILLPAEAAPVLVSAEGCGFVEGGVDALGWVEVLVWVSAGATAPV